MGDAERVHVATWRVFVRIPPVLPPLTRKDHHMTIQEHKNGRWLICGTAQFNRADLFQVDDAGKPKRFVGTFNAGGREQVEAGQFEKDCHAIVDALANTQQ